MREVVWLEGMAYVHPLAWIRQVMYPQSLIPVEPDYIYMPEGQLSTFWSWVYGSYGERRAWYWALLFWTSTLYPIYADDGLQTGSIFGERFRPWDTKAVKPLWSFGLTLCLVGIHAETLCLSRTLILWKVYCRQRRMDYDTKWVTSTQMECYCGR